MTLAAHSTGSRRAVRLFYRGLRASGATALSRRMNDAALILCYHNVVPRGEVGGDSELHMPVERFEEQMRWLAARYEVVSLPELVRRFSNRARLKKVAAITFDDGYAGVFAHAVPVLAALGLTATVFVVADAPGRLDGFWWDHPSVVASLTPTRRERWLTCLRGDGRAILSDVDARGEVHLGPAHRPADWSVIRSAAARGIDIGAHSASHRALPTLSDTELEDEVAASRDVIDEATGVRPQTFAYPYGRWDLRTCAAVRRAGYVCGLSLDTGLNSATSDTSCLRRVNVPAGISQPAFEAWAAGLHFRRA